MDTRTLPERVAEQIRELICSGEVSPEAPLRQQELADRFGVSLIPVREALRGLEKDGLITFLPYRGACVAPLSVEELEQTAEMRIALITIALRKAIPKMTPDVFAHAEEILDQIESEGDPLRWGLLILRFYETLFEPANRPLLVEAIRGLTERIQRYLHVYLVLYGQREIDLPPLRDVLLACKKCDARLAVRLIDKHSLARRLIRELRGRLDPHK
jgi:DNA-binding GntR family transcriptional regulator